MPNYFIGLLSGTSVDAIDAGLWSFDHNACQLVHAVEAPIGSKIKSQILELSTQGHCHLSTLGQLDTRMGELFANAVLYLIKQANVKASDVVAIGSHGQTLWHQPTPPHPFTLQIGDPNVIAQQTQIPVVADFRRADVALGGQGAPLAPAFHRWAFSANEDRFIVNIGGIANLSFLAKDPSKPTLGFDTGPGNGLMDAWVHQHCGTPYDKGGQFATSGQVLPELLQQLLSHPFFQQTGAKSTGKETFNLNWLEPYLKSEFAAEDVQATLLALTTQTLAKDIKVLSPSAQVYLCGGGVHNLALLEQLQQNLGQSYQVASTETLGYNPDLIESACFAWLAWQRVLNNVIEIKAITGARDNTLLGNLFLPSSQSLTTVNRLQVNQ